jgi:sigma-B regulation protein RsbU (phosphoserine phosphatase)
MYEQNIEEVVKTVSFTIEGNKLQEIVDKLSSSDSAEVKRYQDGLKDDKVYQETLSLLRHIKNINHVKFLYIQKFEKNGAVAIMDTDTSSNKFIPGKKYKFSKGEEGIDLKKGTGIFEGYDDEYGDLISISSPIFNDKNEVIAMMGVDISTQTIHDTLRMTVIKMAIVILIAMLVLISLLYLFLDKIVIHPIGLISGATRKFVQSLYLSEEGEAFEVTDLNIHSKDELGRLAYDIQIMEEEINEYIVNLTKVTRDKERIGTELNVATQIQSDMLPKIFPFEPERREFDLHALMRPAKEVGGDFYDFFMLDQDHVAIVIGDVSDKGVPAALFMVISKTLIKDYTQAGMPVNEVFDYANNELCEGNEASLFTTGILGIFNINTGKLLYADAGHEPLIVMNTKDQTVRYVEPKKRNFVLGGMEGTKYAVNEMTLDPGDVLLLYTDGVPDAMNESEEAFGWDRLTKVCQDHLNEEPHEMLKNILADLDKYIGSRAQFDDITMLALKVIARGEDDS